MVSCKNFLSKELLTGISINKSYYIVVRFYCNSKSFVARLKKQHCIAIVSRVNGMWSLSCKYYRSPCSQLFVVNCKVGVLADFMDKSDEMGDSSYRRNFGLGMKDEIQHHS